MTSGSVRARVLGDLTGGPKAASIFAAEIGPYAYPCLHKLQADGLVRQDVRTLAYELTDAGRAWLENGGYRKEGWRNEQVQAETERGERDEHSVRRRRDMVRDRDDRRGGPRLPG